MPADVSVLTPPLSDTQRTPMLIYIAGPYSADTELDRLTNVQRALKAGRAILQKGHWPFIPHLTHHYDEWHQIAYGARLASETYMQWDFVILRRCDGLLYLAASPGADRELALARELHLPVYLSAAEIPCVAPVPAGSVGGDVSHD